MGDLSDLLRIEQTPPSPAFIAARALAEARAEWEKVLSLAEAGLAEAGQADSLESPAWTRAVNIGRVVQDLARANCETMRRIERRVSLMAMIEAGRLRTARDAEGDAP